MPRARRSTTSTTCTSHWHSQASAADRQLRVCGVGARPGSTRATRASERFVSRRPKPKHSNSSARVRQRPVSVRPSQRRYPPSPCERPVSASHGVDDPVHRSLPAATTRRTRTALERWGNRRRREAERRDATRRSHAQRSAVDRAEFQSAFAVRPTNGVVVWSGPLPQSPSHFSVSLSACLCVSECVCVYIHYCAR